MNDGDTIFALSTAGPTAPANLESRTDEGSFVDRGGRAPRLNSVLEASAQAFSMAVTAAIVNAESLGSAPSYRDLCPSAFRKLERRGL